MVRRRRVSRAAFGYPPWREVLRRLVLSVVPDGSQPGLGWLPWPVWLAAKSHKIGRALRSPPKQEQFHLSQPVLRTALKSAVIRSATRSGRLGPLSRARKSVPILFRCSAKPPASVPPNVKKCAIPQYAVHKCGRSCRAYRSSPPRTGNVRKGDRRSSQVTASPSKQPSRSVFAGKSQRCVSIPAGTTCAQADGAEMKGQQQYAVCASTAEMVGNSAMFPASFGRAPRAT